MKIGMVLDNEFSGDLRVENEIITLSQGGHKVFLLCLNFGGKEKAEEFYGAKVIRISIPKFVKKKLAGLNNTILNLYPIFWSIHIKKFIEMFEPDALHVHDLWMLNGAFSANKKYNLPIISDLHENYVHALDHYKFANTFPGNILISKRKWAQSEIDWCNKADRIITVIEEAIERYKLLGVSEQKITVVPNYVNLNNFLNQGIDTSISEKFRDFFTAVYVGGFDIHRGLESAIRSVPIIIKKIKNFKLVLVGYGKNYENLRSLAEDLSIEEFVSFEGWQPADKLSSYISSADICLIPHLKTEHTDNTIPHKLFQYMILEKPVVASDCDPLKRILDETNAGFLYNSNDENELAEKILFLFDHPDLRKESGRRGKEAALKKYNWDTAGKNLLSLYSELKIKDRVE